LVIWSWGVDRGSVPTETHISDAWALVVLGAGEQARISNEGTGEELGGGKREE